MGSLLVEEGQSNNKNLHAICVPYPAQGHIKPMFQLAKLLHAHGFHITFVHTEYNFHRMLRARGPTSVDGLERFRFETIPDGLPPSDNPDVTQDIPSLCHAIMTTFHEPFKNLVRKLVNDSGSRSMNTFIVSDIVMPFTIDAAREVGNVPLVWLWTASGCGLLGYMQFRTLLNKGIVPFQDSKFLTDGTLDEIVDWVPDSMKGIQLKYIPTFFRITTNDDDFMFDFLMHSVETTAKSSAPVLMNTFDALEHDVLLDVSDSILGQTYTIGPLQFMLNNDSDDSLSFGSNLWKEDTDCLQWLDTKFPKSVVYISFGSITTMANENLVEFAWGIANSKQYFLWVLRPDLVSGENSVIPPEFLSETAERGMITSWCEQEQVLRHASVGAFLTHCGWNSTLDTVCGGVPVLCWPFFAEQQTNCWFGCRKWGIGMEIDSDVSRDEVEKQVRELMEGEKGVEMRKNAMQFRKLAEDAVDQTSCGSSYLNFDKFIKQILIPLQNQDN
uniref:Glycosyltransferase n=1 Tax=Dianthus caryophyllus TaxID=3570 RepID=A7M6J1_DIACA|nr:glucosyltransferase [Dianthus caryophyllus]